LRTCNSIINIRSGLSAISSPDTFLFCSLSARLLNDYALYGIFGCSISDSKIPDAQSAYEFATNADNYAMMLLNDEFFTNIIKFLNVLNFDRKSMAQAIIEEIGPGQSYLQH
jgi:trimethylamine:corrinoid methyltransferase-like protein